MGSVQREGEDCIREWLQRDPFEIEKPFLFDGRAGGQGSQRVGDGLDKSEHYLIAQHLTGVAHGDCIFHRPANQNDAAAGAMVGYDGVQLGGLRRLWRPFKSEVGVRKT